VIGDDMNKKESDEGSHDWEKAHVAKELIRLEKQAAEKRARLKNKLKWLGKEPRASFFYFFFLALYFEKLRGQLVVPKAELDVIKKYHCGLIPAFRRSFSLSVLASVTGKHLL
jgi:hypothetical protein